MGDLKIDLKFASKAHLESETILGLSRGLQYPYYRGANQADVCYCKNVQVDMGINMGMYSGVTSRHSIFNPCELRR